MATYVVVFKNYKIDRCDFLCKERAAFTKINLSRDGDGYIDIPAESELLAKYFAELHIRQHKQ